MNAQFDVNQLNEADKREVAQHLMNEQQKSQIQTSTRYLLLPQPPSPLVLHLLTYPFLLLPSGPPSLQHLLEEMHNVQDLVRRLGPERGGVRDELRREIHGCERRRVQAFADYEGSAGRTLVRWTSLRR